MDKRILWSIIVVLAIAVTWLATHPRPSADADQTASASESPAAHMALSADAHPTSPGDGINSSAEAAAKTGGTPPNALASPVTALAPAAGSAAATGDALPIDTSPGFEYLDTPVPETNSLWPILRRHQQLQSEPRDDAWAPRMEDALRTGIQDFLTAQGFDTQRIELPVIECRSNGCEIQAVGYPEDLGKSPADLQRIFPSLLKGDLGNELHEFSALHRSRNDHRVLILVHLSRKTT
jgi:hypothetical protein